MPSQVQLQRSKRAPLTNSVGLESGTGYLRGCFQSVLDLAIARNIRLGGGRNLQLRVDMFNAFNHPIFQLPNGSIALAAAGRVTDTAAPRQIMFGFRYSF